METTLELPKNTLTQKQKAVIAHLAIYNPDILDYYSQMDLEELIENKISIFYEDFERNLLLGMQAPEAEEIAAQKLFNFETSYSKLQAVLEEYYVLKMDISSPLIKGKSLYFAKEYRTLIEEGKNITTLIDAFFMV
jgi:hypothetical protein